ncbi:hypothetical protein SAMN05421798_1901, partial [Pseudovibrio axinellae]|uniref:hypothetical protein n=1 Tax=Pseudovibrio axinellae TaxID=989403 RepID=UPI0008ACD1B6
MRKIVIVLLALLCLPAPVLAHIEVSSAEDIDQIGIIRTCKYGLNSVGDTSGVLRLWALQEFGDQTSLIVAEWEDIQTNLRGRIGFLVNYILMGEGGFDSGRVFVTT